MRLVGSIMHDVSGREVEPPAEGRIVIEWKRVPAELGLGDFDWDVRMEPPGLADEDAARLLREIADRL